MKISLLLFALFFLSFAQDDGPPDDSSEMESISSELEISEFEPESFESDVSEDLVSSEFEMMMNLFDEESVSDDESLVSAACTDRHRSCPHWRRYCKYNHIKNVYCRKTCGTCRSTPVKIRFPTAGFTQNKICWYHNVGIRLSRSGGVVDFRDRRALPASCEKKCQAEANKSPGITGCCSVNPYEPRGSKYGGDATAWCQFRPNWIHMRGGQAVHWSKLIKGQAKPKPRPTGPCPKGFPRYYDLKCKHQPHGDICYNGRRHGWNVGWRCPNHCNLANKTKRPYCTNKSDGKPCSKTKCGGGSGGPMKDCPRGKSTNVQTKNGFKCDTCKNFMNYHRGYRYHQTVITRRGGGKSIDTAITQCAAACKGKRGCTGFFFQTHSSNGHQICGYYTKAINWGDAQKHGHRNGAVCQKL